MAYAYLGKGSKIMSMHCRTGYNLFTLYKRRNKTPMLLSLIIHCVSERLHTFSVVFEPKTSTRGIRSYKTTNVILGCALQVHWGLMVYTQIYHRYLYRVFYTRST